MQTFFYPGESSWKEILERPSMNLVPLQKTVKEILEKVRLKGDKAVKKYSLEFDGVKPSKLLVTAAEIEKAASLVPAKLKDAINVAYRNIYRFHEAQQSDVERIETMPGVACWRRSVPIERVGLYIPGGSAPLFSTVLMLGIPASIAGCREIILCTPPQNDGTVHPAILYAATCCGINTIYKAGGVQAIAAMAYGTETIPAVYKIFGPGNQYVTLAKQLVQQQGTAMDMPAGPSEVLVIADEEAVPAFVAADLLSQAEHGPDSQVVLVTTSETIAENVKAATLQQLKKLPRKKLAQRALRNSRIIIVENIETAVQVSDTYAPEHLILACANAEEVAAMVTSAGSVFIGNYSPESVGDYASGTNHTLPTNGNAAMYSGVSTDSFVKKITYQQLSREGLEAISGTVMEMATAEGLDAHRNAVAIRLKN
jgi:histidinol dehydrogenase